MTQSTKAAALPLLASCEPGHNNDPNQVQPNSTPNLHRTGTGTPTEGEAMRDSGRIAREDAAVRAYIISMGAVPDNRADELLGSCMGDETGKDQG